MAFLCPFNYDFFYENLTFAYWSLITIEMWRNKYIQKINKTKQTKYITYAALFTQHSCKIKKEWEKRYRFHARQKRKKNKDSAVESSFGNGKSTDNASIKYDFKTLNFNLEQCKCVLVIVGKWTIQWKVGRSFNKLYQNGRFPLKMLWKKQQIVSNGLNLIAF